MSTCFDMFIKNVSKIILMVLQRGEEVKFWPNLLLDDYSIWSCNIHLVQPKNASKLKLHYACSVIVRAVIYWDSKRECTLYQFSVFYSDLLRLYYCVTFFMNDFWPELVLNHGLATLLEGAGYLFFSRVIFKLSKFKFNGSK